MFEISEPLGRSEYPYLLYEKLRISTPIEIALQLSYNRRPRIKQRVHIFIQLFYAIRHSLNVPMAHVRYEALVNADCLSNPSLCG